MWNDYPVGSPQQAALDETWSINVGSWLQQAYAASIPAAPNGTPGVSYFYDPSTTAIPPGTGTLQVAWPAWPNRLDVYLSASGGGSANPYGWTHEQILELADTGYVSTEGGALTFPAVPTGYALQCPELDWNPANVAQWLTFGPYGPRGWLDEYCEWSVLRDARGNVIRIDFTCENPEYWYTLWSLDPEKVRSLYEATLNFDLPQSQPERRIAVALDDLVLHDPATGAPVIDPATGRPAYNPLNRWNSSPIARRGAGSSTGGAMHLTSTPNTLQTEMVGLASPATIQRNIDPTQTQELICCSQYGQVFRNSDPHIGQSVNLAVAAGSSPDQPNAICLADPMGLYLQMPLVEYWSFRDGADVPANAQPSDCWQVVRGSVELIDPVTGKLFPGQDYSGGRNGVGNFILHAALQIPSAWIDAGCTATLSDLEINGEPLRWAGQIANIMHVALYARPIPGPKGKPATYSCLPIVPPPAPSPPPQTANQLMDAVLWNAYYATAETIVQPAASQPLASNTVIMAARVTAGAAPRTMVVIATPPFVGPPLPTFLFSIDGVTPDDTVTASIAGGPSISGAASVTYAVPGNSYPGPCTAFTIEVTVRADAPRGLRQFAIVYPGQTPSYMPGLLYVLEPSPGGEDHA